MFQDYASTPVCNNLLIFLAFFLLLFTPSVLATLSSKRNNLAKFFLEICMTSFPRRTLPSYLTSRFFIFATYAGCVSFAKKCSRSPVWGSWNILPLDERRVQLFVSCLHLLCSSLAAVHTVLSVASQSVYAAVSFVLVTVRLWPFNKVFFTEGLFRAGDDSATETVILNTHVQRTCL